MPRPQKKNADYFSHDADMRNDSKILAVRSKYWLEWYAVWCMLLEKLADSNHFRVDYSPIDRELLAWDFRIESGLFDEMIMFFESIWLIDFGDYETIDPQDVRRYSFIYCRKLDERLQQVVDKRERAKISAENRNRNTKWEFETASNWNSKTKSVGVSVTETPQSKVKESKVNKIKDSMEDIAKEVASATTPPPPPEDVKNETEKKDPLRERALAIVEWKSESEKKATELARKKQVAERNNKLIDGIKKILHENGMAYKPDRMFERARANLFFVSKDFADLASIYNMTPWHFALELCRLASTHKFWSWRVYNTVTLYDNFAGIHNDCKANFVAETKAQAKKEEKATARQKML